MNPGIGLRVANVCLETKLKRCQVVSQQVSSTLQYEVLVLVKEVADIAVKSWRL